MPRLKTIVMVPKGAEFKAVESGLQSYLKGNQATKFLTLVSLPVGPSPVRAFLDHWCQALAEPEDLGGAHVVVMGLCGSLSPTLTIGDAVIFQRCLNGQLTPSGHEYICSLDVPIASANRIISTVTPVTGVTCDRVISSVRERQQIRDQYGAEVVDMEGVAVHQSLEKWAKKISILRVVSDDAAHDLPDLSQAFDDNGNILGWVIAQKFLRRPLAALQLIQGSLQGLNVLKRLAQDLGEGLANLDSSLDSSTDVSSPR